MGSSASDRKDSDMTELTKLSLSIAIYLSVIPIIFISLYIIYILFHILFYYDLLQDIEYRSLCYTIGSCYFSMLYTIVSIC